MEANLLPPASKGRGKVLFSVCLSVHTLMGGRGYPSQVWMVGAVPWPGLDGGWVTPARSEWWEGVPWPGLDGGGGYSSQVWIVGYPP